MVQVY